MKLHVLHCGTIRVSEAAPFGGEISLKNTARRLAAPDRDPLARRTFEKLRQQLEPR